MFIKEEGLIQLRYNLWFLWSLLVFVILLCIDNVIFCSLSHIGPVFTLHYMSVRFALALENVFDVAKDPSWSFPGLVTRHREHYSPFSIIDPRSLFSLDHCDSRGPRLTGEDIDIGRVSATRRRRHCAAEAMKKGEEKSGGKRSREWRGKWRKKGDHRSARTIDKRPG